MCDYSLRSVRSRKAKELESLTTHNFGGGTNGFRPTGEAPTTNPQNTTAVCVMPGTKLRFEQPIEYYPEAGKKPVRARTNEALFHQVDKEHADHHHDVLDLPGGQQIYLTMLVPGQHAIVAELPSAQDAKIERAEYV